MLPIHTILCPTDFSPPARNAFRLASALARDYSARLIVMHVIEQPLLIYSGVMAPPPPPDISAEEREGLLKKLHQLVPDDPTVSVEHLLVEGEPSTAILKISQERHCDLIVMGSHGRTGLYRLLMGSVAEQVLRKGTCPVLTVKTPIPANTPEPSRPSREPANV